MKVALVGDYDAAVTAHQAIPRALELAALALATRVEQEWIGSDRIGARDLADFDGLWCVPLSPYRDAVAVIDAIEYARSRDLPFLGTCAGFQHAVLEYARNVLDLSEADSLEDNPQTAMPLITALACRLSDESDAINLTAGSRLERIYQTERIVDEYNCGFGINRDYLSRFADSEMTFCAFDDHGEARAFELERHPFFVGTAFQPERSALHGQTHPLICAFLMAME